ncbi:DEAD/DEAH box helicase family protein [Propionivibrio sp.]|uniref:DEAD/DEAH box helicase family protein n=1 Tax=Propionivibrio sp. TaxID=2212460 RepID=UPI003BF14255
MELKLYKRLKAELLGSLATAAESFNPAYQQGVERLAPEAESGLAAWGRNAIADYLREYARLTKPVRLRYYQVLALYFAEAVLRGRRAGEAAHKDRNMLAYWMATGSGKTLLMHLNILQYIAHLGGGEFSAGLRAFDELQIVLTTPGVNLIEQHRREVIPLVDALNRLCANRIKLTVESTGSLLNAERGFFRMPPSTRVFRLVLVDEGHIGLASGGATAGAFKKLRHDLADYPNAFLFEYSATYHGVAEQYVRDYEEQIVFDYNYYRFYKDSYGKDYSIQTIGADQVAATAEAWENFAQAFATLAEKLTLHHELRTTAAAGLPFAAQFADKPLIAFMGNTVEDSKKEGSGTGDEVSDIRKLLAYLAKLPASERERFAPVFNAHTSGLLTLTRCPAVADEIWLSWGDGGYWGIVNVGNGDKFYNDSDGHADLKDAHGQPLVQLRKRPIVERACHFAEIDRPGSPINVLIGSRKFAEGWNCYRLSVIGLINLGSGKGNKIIQIFGRGVRLKGLKGDGKRQAREHHADYAALVAEDTPANRLRRLETLNIYSLKATYLTRFLEAMKGEIPQFVLERTVPVTTRPVAMGPGKGTEDFSAYQGKLPVFKVGRDSDEPRLVVTRQADGQWRWGEEANEALAWSGVQLDYRRDADSPEHDLRQDLYNWLAAKSGAGAVVSSAASFGPSVTLAETLTRALAQRNLQLLWEGGANQRLATALDLLSVIGGLLYHHPFGQTSLAVRENLANKAVADAVAQLHHKLIYDINKRRYRFGEPLVQAVKSAPGIAGVPGDFIAEYTVKLGFRSEPEMTAFDLRYPSPMPLTQLELRLEEPCHPYQPHIYKPLLFKDDKDAGQSGLNFTDLSISPDALNLGERKFVDDLHNYLKDPARHSRAARYSFYLMRNVESLRSVGVYLDTEARAYFPDFVLWVVGKNKTTTMLLIDPKGQSGILDLNSLSSGSNAKVKLAHSGQLQELARQLSEAITPRREVSVHSFILLRDSSPLGKLKGTVADTTELAIIEDMQRCNVLRLDWARRDELGNSRPVPEERCYLERMFALAGVG